MVNWFTLLSFILYFIFLQKKKVSLNILPCRFPKPRLPNVFFRVPPEDVKMAIRSIYIPEIQAISHQDQM